MINNFKLAVESRSYLFWPVIAERIVELQIKNEIEKI